MRKIISLLLAAVTLATTAACFASCADQKENSGNTGEVKPTLEHLEGLDFGGEEVNFIIAGADGDYYNQRSIYVDEESGDAVDNAIYERNEKVQSMLNVEIVALAEANDSITNQAKNVLLSGSDEYDIIAARQYDDIQLALEGVVHDLNTLPELGADYIKWQNEYWASSYIDALTFGNKNYWLAGDLCLRFSGGLYCMFVNTRHYNDILANKYGSIYDIVRDKKWTYDMLMEMAKLSMLDESGDDEMNVDEGDRAGLLLTICDNINGMAISSGVVFTDYSSGQPANAMKTTNAVLTSFMEKCHALTQAEGVQHYGAGAVTYEEAFGHFASGEAVFVSGRINNAEMYLREMEDDYYVIPCPMLNEEQGAYYAGVHDSSNIYGISAGSSKVPAAAATLEALAYESYYEIRPIYYDSFLKFKYTRDDEAAEMIDLMHDGVYTDFVFIWQFSDEMDKLGFFLRDTVLNKNWSSSLKKRQDKWDTGLESILEQIEAME